MKDKFNNSCRNAYSNFYEKPTYILGKVLHQRSGLDCNLHNYIYQTYDEVHFRNTKGGAKIRFDAKWLEWSIQKLHFGFF